MIRSFAITCAHAMRERNLKDVWISLLGESVFSGVAATAKKIYVITFAEEDVKEPIKLFDFKSCIQIELHGVNILNITDEFLPLYQRQSLISAIEHLIQYGGEINVDRADLRARLIDFIRDEKTTFNYCLDEVAVRKGDIQARLTLEVSVNQEIIALEIQRGQNEIQREIIYCGEPNCLLGWVNRKTIKIVGGHAVNVDIKERRILKSCAII